MRWTNRDRGVDGAGGEGVYSGSHPSEALGGVFLMLEGKVETVG